MEGSFLNTLVLTDIATGWTECIAFIRRSEADVAGALEVVRQDLPFPMLGFGTDNGSEFINHEMIAYCDREKITFTRSRPCRKNDQRCVRDWHRVEFYRQAAAPGLAVCPPSPPPTTTNAPALQ